MALFQGDVIIKTAIELAIEDLKKEPWLIVDIFSDFIENPILKRKYGMSEINKAKEYLLNNKINYYMRHRIDAQQFPCITISMGNSEEDRSLATLGDQSVCVEELLPEEIGKPIQYIVKPFQVISYDATTGIVEIPLGTEGYQYIGEGMLAVDPETGNGWIIKGKAGVNGFEISQNIDLNVDKMAIIPRYQAYRARRERIISQEQYNIGCHASGDSVYALYLFYLTKYALLRYREGLLEYNNFQLSNISCTDFIKNDAFGADNVFSRFIVLSGQVEESWIKTPFRVLEAIELIDNDEALDENLNVAIQNDQNPVNNAGIKVFSNKDTIADTEEDGNDLWITIETNNED